MRTHPCPKCGRLLEQTGEVTVSGETVYPVFQCDDCVIDTDFGGEKFPMNYTFCLDEQGRAFDPADNAPPPSPTRN